jgi:hypothetical protein
MPLKDFEPKQISFTYPDSMVSYWLQTQTCKNYYRDEYHGRVFSMDEILELIDRFGISDRDWQVQTDRKYDLFIEAQIWNIESIDLWGI